MSVRTIHFICLVISFTAFTLNLTANSSDHWWVSLKPQEFERVGLWQICFNHYRHRFDFYGKIYQGCWWIFSPETRMLFTWLSTEWLRVVQAFSTLSLLSSLLALLLTFMLVANRNLSKVSSRFILMTAFVTLTSSLFMTIACITFGLKGKNRDWMPRWQQNWYGWSFHIAVACCILEYIVGFILLFEGVNMKLVKAYMEKMYIQKKRLFPPAPRMV
jgi:hypothetical protein